MTDHEPMTCEDCLGYFEDGHVEFCPPHAKMIRENPRKVVELQTLNDHLQKKLATQAAEIERRRRGMTICKDYRNRCRDCRTINRDTHPEVEFCDEHCAMIGECEVRRKDERIAASDLLIPIPEPGTDMAKMLTANCLLRSERNARQGDYSEERCKRVNAESTIAFQAAEVVRLTRLVGTYKRSLDAAAKDKESQAAEIERLTKIKDSACENADEAVDKFLDLMKQRDKAVRDVERCNKFIKDNWPNPAQAEGGGG